MKRTILILGLLLLSGCEDDIQKFQGQTAEQWYKAYKKKETELFNAQIICKNQKEPDPVDLRQNCLSAGYSPNALHVCPAQKTADDFEYLCNDRYTDGIQDGLDKGFANCMKHFGIPAIESVPIDEALTPESTTPIEAEKKLVPEI